MHAKPAASVEDLDRDRNITVEDKDEERKSLEFNTSNGSFNQLSYKYDKLGGTGALSAFVQRQDSANIQSLFASNT